MTRMTEPDSISRRLLRSVTQTSELMTRAARRNVSPVCLRAGRVTAKTRDMRIQPRRNRKPNATTVPSMTRSTTRVPMLRMIESRIETTQRWKRFDLPTLNVRVADRADRAC